MHDGNSAPAWAARFGYAGLLPQAAFLAMVLAGDGLRWVGQAGSFAYAALIFSFVGGLWWGQAMAAPTARASQFGLAVAPSLIGLACFMPWVWGLAWPAPYLAVLGALLALSPLIDRLAFDTVQQAAAWHRLRLRLSLALGLMTVLIAVL